MFSEVLYLEAESFLESGLRSWPTGEERARITESSNLVRAEHLDPWVMDLIVTSLPIMCDPESKEGGLDSGSESPGDSGHWHLSDCFPAWRPSPCLSHLSGSWMRPRHICMPEMASTQADMGIDTSKARLQVWTFLQGVRNQRCSVARHLP